jgi:hypothetical protein
MSGRDAGGGEAEIIGGAVGFLDHERLSYRYVHRRVGDGT